jgi:hypothetical protein
MSVSSALQSRIGKQVSFTTDAKVGILSTVPSTLISVLLAKGVWILSLNGVVFTVPPGDFLTGYNVGFQDTVGDNYGSYYFSQPNTDTVNITQPIISSYVSDGINDITVGCSVTSTVSYDVSAGILNATRIA